MGEDQLWPGVGVFQAMLDVAFHSMGTFFSDDIPCLVGPRKQGQFSAGDELTAAKASHRPTERDILR